MTDFAPLAAALIADFPSDAARVLEGFPPGQVAELLPRHEPVAATGLLAALSPSIASEVVAALAAEDAAALLTRLPPRAAATLLRRAGDAAGPIYSFMAESTAATLRRLASYPPATAGAVMEVSVVTVAEEITATMALELFRRQGDQLQHYLYSTHADGRLAGVVSPVDLALASPETAVAELANRDLASLRDDDDLIAIATHPGWNQWRSLPVVDRDGRFLGAVRHREIRKLLAQQSGGQSLDAISLPISLAELFWLGLVGFTEGLAHVVAQPRADDDR